MAAEKWLEQVRLLFIVGLNAILVLLVRQLNFLVMSQIKNRQISVSADAVVIQMSVGTKKRPLSRALEMETCSYRCLNIRGARILHVNTAVIITLLEQQIDVAASGLLHTAVKKRSVAGITVTIIWLVRPTGGEGTANGSNWIYSG